MRTLPIPPLARLTSNSGQIRVGLMSGAPAEDSAICPEWISAAEWLEGEVISDPARRRQWLAGRWVLKDMVRERFSLLYDRDISPAEITVRSRNGEGRQTAPRLWCRNQPLPLFCSISHSPDAAVAAISERGQVGVDLLEEEALLENGQLRSGGWDCARWSLVEAAFKTGICPGRFQPFRWKVSPLGPNSFLVRSPDQTRVLGKMCRVGMKQIALCWGEGFWDD